MQVRPVAGPQQPRILLQLQQTASKRQQPFLNRVHVERAAEQRLLQLNGFVLQNRRKNTQKNGCYYSTPSDHFLIFNSFLLCFVCSTVSYQNGWQKAVEKKKVVHVEQQQLVSEVGTNGNRLFFCWSKIIIIIIRSPLT